MLCRKLFTTFFLVTMLVGVPLSTSAVSNAKSTVSLKQHFQEDHGYRNRYLAGWSFFWLLMIIGLFVLLNPHQKGPEAR